MKKCCGVLRIAMGITMLALLLAGSANAATITVNASGGGDYSRIQDAIDNANNGDTILVSGGATTTLTYYENVNVNKQLNLRGISNPVVDAGGSGSAITLAANGISLEGFTVTGSGYYAYTEAGIKVTSSNNTLIGNNVYSNNNDGISLGYSSNNAMSNNTASNNNRCGILLGGSSNNTLTGNSASNNKGSGIHMYDSSKNKLKGNNASNNQEGISLSLSNNNILTGNNASNNNSEGIFLWDSNNNTLSRNNASNNGKGILLFTSSKNTLSSNIMTGNQINFDLEAYTDSDFNNHINTSNLVDGRSIFYIVKASDTMYDSSSNAGTFYCISCVNVTIKNLNLNKNGIGIYFRNTSKSRIQNVTASNNEFGISLFSSSNNTMDGNNVTNNQQGDGIDMWSSSNNTLNSNNVSKNYGHGIYLSSSNNNTLSSNNVSNNGKNRYNVGAGGIVLWSSSNNNIYNNLFKNRNNVEIYNSINRWNISQIKSKNIIIGSYIGGNFWAHPKGKGFSQTCPDLNNDGICDKIYIINSKNIDYLPLAKDKIPPKSVSNLKNITYAKTYINWTWKDPKDIDFKKVMVFIDGKLKKNVSKGKRFYNSTNFTANTRHSISTWTVDWNGNINKTWKNSSVWTAK